MCEPRAGWTSTVVARHSFTKMRTHEDTGTGPIRSHIVDLWLRRQSAVAPTAFWAIAEATAE